MREKLSSIADTWEYLTGQERQSLIRDCVSRIVITGEKVEIFYTFL